MTLYVLLVASVVLPELALVILAGLTWEADDLGDPPPELDAASEVRSAHLITSIAAAFLLVAVVAYGITRDKEGLGLLPIASLVLCGWSAVRLLIAGGGMRKAAEAMLLGGVTLLLVSVVSAMLGAALILK